jgi:hypothetical protein
MKRERHEAVQRDAAADAHARPRSPLAHALLASSLVMLPLAARAEVITLHEMLGGAGSALRVMLAEAEYDAAEADWDRARSEKGWQLSIGAGYGRERDVIDETRAREFEAIRTQVSLSYPLLGAYAKQEREVEIAAGKVAEARIQRNAALKVAELHVEDVYAALWGAQESLEVVEAYLKTDPGPGARAGADRRRLARRRDEARARLERLVERKLSDVVVTTVQLPKIPELDAKRLEQDHPELAAIRAQHAGTRAQLNGSVWYGIDAAFDVTQRSLQDRSGGQAGNGLFANFTVSLPLTFHQAGLSERRKLRAEMAVLELELRDKSDEIVTAAHASEAEHLDLYDEVEAVAEKVRGAAQALREAGARPAANALRNYYALALEEVEARMRFWRSHVAMRSYVPIGAAEPAPEPPGPTIADVGSRLAEPLLKAARGS